MTAGRAPRKWAVTPTFPTRSGQQPDATVAFTNTLKSSAIETTRGCDANVEANQCQARAGAAWQGHDRKRDLPDETSSAAEREEGEGRRAGEGGVAWEDVSTMGEREVYDLLFPEQAELNEATAQIEYDYVPPS